MPERDRKLIVKIKEGNEDALEQLFEKYYYRLCDFAFQYVRSFDLTEEIVSDVFMKIWKKRHTLTAEGNLKAYLFTAVRNQALNYIEQEKKMQDSIEDLPRPLASDKYHPEEELLFQEFQNKIETLVSELPPRRRMIFKMSRFENFTYREIADILSISVHTVQNQMVEAVKQLSSYVLVNE